MSGDSEYWYVRPAYSIKGSVVTDAAHQGSVGQDPVSACIRHTSSFEKQFKNEYGWRPNRSGSLFVAWRLPGKVSRKDAIDIVKDRRPDKVYVLLEKGEWKMTLLSLHDETPFEFSQPPVFDD